MSSDAPQSIMSKMSERSQEVVKQFMKASPVIESPTEPQVAPPAGVSPSLPRKQENEKDKKLPSGR